MTQYFDQNGKEITLPDVDLTKINLEDRRYKQDCRKRVLDLASSELMNDKILYNKSADMTIGKRGDVNGEGWEPPKYDVMSLADKYYDWLISIP